MSATISSTSANPSDSAWKPITWPMPHDVLESAARRSNASACVRRSYSLAPPRYPPGFEQLISGGELLNAARVSRWNTWRSYSACGRRSIRNPDPRVSTLTTVHSSGMPTPSAPAAACMPVAVSGRPSPWKSKPVDCTASFYPEAEAPLKQLMVERGMGPAQYGRRGVLTTVVKRIFVRASVFGGKTYRVPNEACSIGPRGFVP